MRAEIRQLLIESDEKGAFEFPSDFNETNLEIDVRKVLAELESNGLKLRFEDWGYNQDASFGLAIIFEEFSIDKGNTRYEPTIRFSNFGRLVTISWLELIPSEKHDMILDILKTKGFSYISLDELDSPYDGVNAPNNNLPTWWIRFFDYL